jgi:hypothetical protein
MTDQGRTALGLAHLKLCRHELTKAHREVTEAAGLADALAFTQRLAFAVEGDLRT